MAAVSNVIPLGLLYMRPLQCRLKTRGFSLRGNPLRMIKVTWRCLRALDMWRQTLFLSSGPGAGSSLSLRNASDRRVPHRLGSGHEWPPCPRSVEWSPSHVAYQLSGDIGHVRALKHFLPDLRDRHVLVRTDNTAVVSNINHQGGPAFIRIRIRIRMSFIGQVCLHIRGICYSDKAPQCNRMTATDRTQTTKRTIYKYTNRQCTK